LIQIERVEKAYEKLSRDMQIRKNKLQSSSVQSLFIQLSSSSSSQASRSFSSIEIYQNDSLSEIRTQYESDNRQNRHIDIRNRQFTESRHENRSFKSESRFENQYDRESNRFRNRQYEITEYANENLRSVNQIRRASQSDYSDYQTFESYVSFSSSKIIYAKELSTLNKLYKNEEKFDDTENNFDFKLTIYLDKCKFADLSKHAYEKDVSLMLTNETLTYYYVNRDNFITFNDFLSRDLITHNTENCESRVLMIEESQK
jgi:Ni/Co efflux regulator RcnB